MTYALVICPAEFVPQARVCIESEFGFPADVAAQEFVPAASADGKEPATHFWLATRFTPEELAKAQTLAAQVPGARVESYDLDADPLRPWAVLAEMKLIPLTFDQSP